MRNYKEETRVFSSFAESKDLRNMANEINEFVREGRDVKIEYHNINTKDYGFVIATVTASIPDHTPTTPTT
jgi:hypothetical protein